MRDYKAAWREDNKYNIILLFLSCCTATAVSMKFAPLKNSSSPEVLFYKGLCDMFPAKSIILTCMLALAVFTFSKYTLKRRSVFKEPGKKDKRYNIVLLIANSIVAFIWLCGESFSIDNTLINLDYPSVQLAKSFIFFFGWLFFLHTCCLYLETLFTIEMIKTKQSKKTISVFTRLFDHSSNKQLWVSVFILLLLLYAPHLFFAYPANLCWDFTTQLRQYYGLMPFAADNPIAFTVLMGSIVNVGTRISGNFGLFLYAFFQTVVLSAIIAYMFCLFKRLKTPIWWRVFSFFMCAFCPYYAHFVTKIIKDNIFAYFYLLLIIELVYLFVEKAGYFKFSHIILLGISIIGVTLLRNNITYAMYLAIVVTTIVLLTRTAKNRSIKNEKPILLFLCCLIVPCFISGMIKQVLMHEYNVIPGSIREVLSVPIQQTARYVKEYPNEITPEERASIDKVLVFDTLAEKYNPTISDPVKNGFKTRSFTHEVKQYLITWLKMFFKHPLVYLKATLNQNYFLFYPFTPNPSVFPTYTNSDYLQTKDFSYLMETYGYYFENVRDRYQETALELYNMWFRLPFLGVLSHISIHIIVTMWLIVYSLKFKLYSMLTISVPNICSVVGALLGPVIIGAARYTFPILFSSPVIFSYFIYLISKADVISVKK